MENSQTRLVARVIRDVVRTERFTSYTELKDALWRRLVKERLKNIQPSVVNDAIHLVESNTVLVRAIPPAPAARVDVVTGVGPIGRAEASDVSARLLAEWRRRTH